MTRSQRSCPDGVHRMDTNAGHRRRVPLRSTRTVTFFVEHHRNSADAHSRSSEFDNSPNNSLFDGIGDEHARVISEPTERNFADALPPCLLVLHGQPRAFANLRAFHLSATTAPTTRFSTSSRSLAPPGRACRSLPALTPGSSTTSASSRPRKRQYASSFARCASSEMPVVACSSVLTRT